MRLRVLSRPIERTQRSPSNSRAAISLPFSNNFRTSNAKCNYSSQKVEPLPPIIDIKNATFYRHHPNSTIAESTPNVPLFPNFNFSLPSFGNERWAIIGPSSSGKTTLLQVLGGKYISIPTNARAWPYLESEHMREKDIKLQNPTRAITRVGFDSEQGIGTQALKGAYLSARYETRREIDDFSVMDYLKGNTELNPYEDAAEKVDRESLKRVFTDLSLGQLVHMPVSNLSNGQTRRARIARALLGNPEVLLLDEPFMGLDPPTLLTLSSLLKKLAEAHKPRLILALRPQDAIPDWITHLVCLRGNCRVASQGPKKEVLADMKKFATQSQNGKLLADERISITSILEVGRTLTEGGIVEQNKPLKQKTLADEPGVSSILPNKVHPPDIKACHSEMSRDGYPMNDASNPVRFEDFSDDTDEPLVEMKGAIISYGSKTVLGNWKQDVDGELKDGLWWTVRRGQRWGIFGPNGSGKTTILSLICSDHPKTYSLPIKLFGRSRLPEPGSPGISIFDIQSRIGHSSPEIHNHITRSLNLRQVLENAWSDTFRGVPNLNESAHDKINACLRWFEQDLRPEAKAPISTEPETTSEGTSLFRPYISQPQSKSEPEISAYLTRSTSWADTLLFGGLPFGAQRVALFLRAIVKSPDLIILDEAFSGMDDAVRDRCLLFLAHGEHKRYEVIKEIGERRVVSSGFNSRGMLRMKGLETKQALVVISHVKEEIPGSVREWICLPDAESKQPPRFGRLAGPIEGDGGRWEDIWGM